jgi:hypothetical protein
MDTNTDRQQAKELPRPIEGTQTLILEQHAPRITKRKSWKEMSLAQKSVSTIMLAAELALTGWVLRDLKQSPAAYINGKKRTWLMMFFIQPFGPLLYLIFGHKRGKALISA